MRVVLQHPLRIILLVFILLAATYSVVVPPFETPDEIWHFAFIQQVASGGGLPVSEANTEALWRQQGGQAPGYYLAAALLTSWIDQSDFPALYERTNPYAAIGGGPDPLNRAYFVHYPQDGWPWQGSFLALHISRFFSIFLAVVALWASYQSLALLVSEKIALLGMALFAFIPQFVFISGAASNDNAIHATSALLLWRLVRLLKDKPSPSRSPMRYLLVGLLLGLVLLSKVSGLWLVPLTIGVLAVIARHARSWRFFGEGVCLTNGVAFLVSGWWFVRNWWLYGDPLASNIWLSNILLRRHPATWRTFWYSEGESLEHSFWGLFGWFNVAYPTWLYRGFQFLELFIIIGLGWRLFRWARDVETRPQLERWQWQGIGVLGLWLVGLTTSWIGFFRMAPAAQGRYFFPAMSILALLMAVGWSQLLGRKGAWGMVGFWLVLSTITPWWIIWPSYQPTTPLASLPEGVTPLEVTFHDHQSQEELIRLEGYTVTPTQLAPSTPMDLTLYWRALRPLDSYPPLSVAVKGFGRAHNGPLIARDDSYPDAGRWPTTLWEPGMVIADRWRIWMSGQTITPTVARLKVDLYQLDREQGKVAAVLPATVGEESVGLPFHFATLVVRAPDAAPAPPQEFVVRPIIQGVSITDTEHLNVNFLWEVGQNVTQEYQVFLHLTADQTQPPVRQTDFEPMHNVFPTSYWWSGDRLADEAQLVLPQTAAVGEYQVLLGLYDLVSGRRLAAAEGQDAWVMARLLWNGENWRVID